MPVAALITVILTDQMWFERLEAGGVVSLTRAMWKSSGKQVLFQEASMSGRQEPVTAFSPSISLTPIFYFYISTPFTASLPLRSGPTL